MKKPPSGGFFLLISIVKFQASVFRAHKKARTSRAFRSFYCCVEISQQLDFLAEEAGFEPAVGLTLRT
ncbi:MAG: hypothetical protein V4772_07190, partial [Pseudomonadota bacterium]